MPAICAQNIVRSFQNGESKIRALDDISFEIDNGEFTVVLGPSGAGKTTLLNIIGGMDSPTSGHLLVSGTDIASLNKRELTEYRRNSVGFVFQFYNLMANLTAKENVELAVEMCKDAYSPEEMLKKVGLGERMNNFPAQLSGGEQQRVSIARALAKNPSIILCDEPTGALDYQTGKAVLKLLHDMCREQKKSVIIVTHNAALKDMADKVIHIKNGHAEWIEKIENPKPIEEIEW